MSEYTLIGFDQASIINDLANMLQAQQSSVSIINPEDFLTGNNTVGQKYIVCVTRDLDLRYKIISFLDHNNLTRGTFVHPDCWIDPTAKIGEGSFVGPFCTVACGAVLEKDVIVGPYTMISHKAQIGQGTLIHTGALIAGSTTIGKRCIVNIRAALVDKITICDNVIVGANSLVTKNISIPGMYLGSPARKSTNASRS